MRVSAHWRFACANCHLETSALHTKLTMLHIKIQLVDIFCRQLYPQRCVTILQGNSISRSLSLSSNDGNTVQALLSRETRAIHLRQYLLLFTTELRVLSCSFPLSFPKLEVLSDRLVVFPFPQTGISLAFHLNIVIVIVKSVTAHPTFTRKPAVRLRALRVCYTN
jgi:hypothetical protein